MTPAARSNGDPRFELANQAACTDWETWVIWECTDRPYHVTSTRPGDRRVKAVAGARVTPALSRAIRSTGAEAIVGAEIPSAGWAAPGANTVGTGLARSPPPPSTVECQVTRLPREPGPAHQDFSGPERRNALASMSRAKINPKAVQGTGNTRTNRFSDTRIPSRGTLASFYPAFENRSGAFCVGRMIPGVPCSTASPFAA